MRNLTRQCFGGFSGEGTPGPIPNPEAKFPSADGTARETGWESRTPPNHPSRNAPTPHRVGAFRIPQTRHRPNPDRGRTRPGTPHPTLRARSTSGCKPSPRPVAPRREGHPTATNGSPGSTAKPDAPGPGDSLDKTQRSAMARGREAARKSRRGHGTGAGWSCASVYRLAVRPDRVVLAARGSRCSRLGHQEPRPVAGPRT